MPIITTRCRRRGGISSWGLLASLLLLVLGSTALLRPGQPMRQKSANSATCNIAAVPSADRCAFVTTHAAECGALIGHINYMHIAYCQLGDKPALAIGLLCAWTALIFAVMLVAAEHFFCPSLEELAQYLQLPDHLAGATLMAFGNGANDCFVMTAALVADGDADGASAALSEALSGGFFITNVVLGLAILFAPTHPVLVGADFRRDLLFYLGAVILVFATVIDGRLFLWESLAMFGFYLVYLVVTVRRSRDQAPLEAPHPVAAIHHEIPRALPMPPLEEGSVLHSPLLNHHSSCSISVDRTPPAPPSSYARQPSTLSQAVVEKLDSLQRTKAAAEWPLVVLLRLLMPQVDPTSAHPRWCAALLPLTAPLLWGVCMRELSMLDSAATAGCWALMALLACALIWSAYPADGLSFGPFAGVFVVFAFLQSMLLLSVCSTELMATSVTVGSLGGLSQSLLAATLLAWGNSLQDLVSNVTMSATGFPLVALTACVAAPLFNLLSGIGLGTLLRTARHGTMHGIAVPNALVVLFAAHCVLLVRLLVEVPFVRRNRLTMGMGGASAVAWLLLMPVYVLTSLGIVFREPWIKLE